MCLGFEKRDGMCMPLMFSSEVEEQPPNLRYLEAARDIFRQWKQSGLAGLTDQTFLACIQTMSAVPELAQYLHEKFDFCYILTGKFTSDPIESRFGWYRQVNGGNFFMSLKQLLEAEKKIQRLSLLQQYGLLAASKLRVNDDEPLATTTSGGTSSSEISWLVNFFSGVVLDDLSENDANLIFHVSGYIARSIYRHRQCSFCKVLLVKSDNPPPLPFCDFEEHSKLFEMANQDGLAQPTEFCFVVTTLAVQYYYSLLLNVAEKAKLFACLNQRSAFLQAVETVVKDSPNFRSVVNQLCLKGHSNFAFIINCAFNCFAKNELKRLNAPKYEDPRPMARKFRILTSRTAKT